MWNTCSGSKNVHQKPLIEYMKNPVDHLCGGETRPFLLNNMFLKLFGRITLFDEIVF
jgi:hypothetical protein